MTTHELRRDPRLDRSRAAILAAAVALLSEGGIERATIEAVTARSGVARSTLYRHFPNSAELLAAAFQELLPPLPAPGPGGTPRDRLLRLVLGQAEQLAHAPTMVAVVWMTASGLSGETPAGADERTRLASLRRHIIDSYRRPFNPVLAECLAGGEPREGDLDLAAAQLIGPLLFNALITRRPNDRAFCARLVDDFLAAHG
ncbi:TetR/AcrR family transcriptional regulator [Amycolatopsis acidiphila]|uniref:TetR/AcrR family transcriptional regulator n=1 Tax=Amycolatopsis acidiphila TaxID=715473 RepID=A0A558A889_9PSEU|nr:TetR/AcrR family transcriptional regulator [Amycolatopsis acidiphila]TVT20468.1 TetR/AcrR family transcriptional regulator [Amycolatopsis acidiphila]UIJ56990.1 TetR/AcrR family transcriptional regulator [Amycolatopsis acidiphila]GHG53942.1 TetR family transcriptional regulator [Amycolatopsis acidiphila]